MSALKTLAPTLEPFATEHIEEMIQLTQILMNKGHAYLAEANVLFSVQSMKDYGALSNRTIEDMLAGARVEIAQYKKHPGDFVLWKPSKSGEPGWDSPWGFGRPGWHLECSAMAHSHLGQDIDIHGGGRDLIFPHHENEIAQSCCAYGGNFVNHWMHNATVDIDGEKMSKSLGNIRTVRDLLKNYRGDVLKLALLSTHYRSPLNFSTALLEQSEKTLTSFYNGLREVDEIPIDEVNIADTSFYAALCDDLNTPLAITELHSMTKRINTGSSSEKRNAKSELLAAGSLLGLLDCEPNTWLQGGLDLISISPEEIESLICLLVNLSDFFSLTKKKTGMLNIPNQTATTILDDLITFSITLTESTNIIGNKKTADNIIINDINPPINPKPQAKPDILPIFFLDANCGKYELHITVPNSKPTFAIIKYIKATI